LLQDVRAEERDEYMVNKIAFRGKYSEELEGLGLTEYTKLLKSRQRRFIKRNPLQYKKLLELIAKSDKKQKNKPIRTHRREAVILPQWIGKIFSVYNGKEFKEIKINATMLGHRLGEFSYSTKHVQHSNPGVKATKGSKFLSKK